jgi:hypothetical protein
MPRLQVDEKGLACSRGWDFPALPHQYERSDRTTRRYETLNLYPSRFLVVGDVQNPSSKSRTAPI